MKRWTETDECTEIWWSPLFVHLNVLFLNMRGVKIVQLGFIVKMWIMYIKVDKSSQWAYYYKGHKGRKVASNVSKHISADVILQHLNTWRLHEDENCLCPTSGAHLKNQAFYPTFNDHFTSQQKRVRPLS